jgi:hypothetical protein
VKTEADERYTSHTEKAVKLLKNKRRKDTASSQVLLDQLEAYVLFATAKDQGKAANHHLIALSTFLKGVGRDESAAGFIHPGVLNGLNAMTEAIARYLKPKASFAEMGLYQKGVLAIGILSVALMMLSKSVVKSGPEPFRQELLMRLFAQSGFGEGRLLALSDTLTQDPVRAARAAKACTAMTLLTLLIAAVQEEVPEDFFEAIQEKVASGLIEAKAITETIEPQGFLMSTLTGIEIALEKREYPLLMELIDALLHQSGSSLEELKKDLNEIQKMAYTIQDAYKVGKTVKPSLIHLVG